MGADTSRGADVYMRQARMRGVCTGGGMNGDVTGRKGSQTSCREGHLVAVRDVVCRQGSRIVTVSPRSPSIYRDRQSRRRWIRYRSGDRRGRDQVQDGGK